MSLRWLGDDIQKKVLEATQKGIDQTMSQAVIEAKQSHPGWNNVTGTAEGSIRVVSFAAQEGERITGIWGSVDVNYMIWLELKRGSALRGAADRTYPKLRDNIQKAL